MGIGVKDLQTSWNWYIKNLGMDCPIFGEEAEAKFMLPYTGGKPQLRHAVLAFNLQSGGGFEIWQYKGRVPQEISWEIKAGNLGIFACKIKVKDIDRSYKFFIDQGINVIGEPSPDPAGARTFFIKDLSGNIFQMVEASDWFMNENKHSGGVFGAVIGVADIEKALVVYSDILGYENVVYDSTGVHPDFSGLPGGNIKLRRVLLKKAGIMPGHFGELMGNSEIELISTGNPEEKKIYEGRFWGDPGFIHLCFDISGIDVLRDYCHEKGHPFTVDTKSTMSGSRFDMGEAAGHFAYIEDGSGTLIEFVETLKMPVFKKIGWYLDLSKRDYRKNLPAWMLKTLRYSKVKVS